MLIRPPGLSKHLPIKGFITIDLLIGLSIGLIISASLLAIWLQLQISTSKSLSLIRFNQDLQAIIHVMAGDIRRAGYWAWTPLSMQPISQNPFMTPTNAITIDKANATETDASCLIYSYDLNQDGQLGGALVEQFGFRLHNQAIEMRTGGSTFSCSAGSWQDISQTDLVITTLNFSIENKIIYPITGCVTALPCITRQLLSITLIAHSASHAAQTTTLKHTITIRNDLLS